jgi:predicted Zn-dependent protease
MLGYSKEDELLADKAGVRYAQKAGFDPHGMISFLKKLKEFRAKKPPAPFSYNRTHPYTPDRIVAIKQELGEEITFKEYINIQK